MTEPAGDATVVVKPPWWCPRGHNAVYRGWDTDGFYWSCRVCGETDNGLYGAEPFRILPKAQKGQERLPPGRNHPSGWADAYQERVEETTQELRARLKRHQGANHGTEA